VVVAFAVLFAIVVPAVNKSVHHGETVRVGDRIALDGGIVFSPAAGWTIVDGTVSGSEPRSGVGHTAEVDNGAVSLSIRTAKWEDSPNSLLAQVRRTTDALTGDSAPRIVGQVMPIVTTTGEQGVISRYRSTTADGAIAAYVIDGTGVEVVVSGPVQTTGTAPAEVAAMITSIAADSRGQDR
ncbi:hypothetical protein ACFVHA_28960, partial [Bacillus cereus]|uniref:hypothetical protein n=1 Tax=Bacillus cereus TaxID=1396 RepID=UPI00362B9DB5